MSTPTSQPSPSLFFNTVNAYQRTAAIQAALELDLFTSIAAGCHTVSDLAQRSGATERGIRILCDYLVILGFLTKADSTYGLTQDTAVFLDRRSPSYVGGAIEFLLAPTIADGFKELATAVRQGGTALPQTGTLEAEHPVWVKFARAMAPMMALPARLMAELVQAESGTANKILDISASHGLFGLAFADLNPEAAIVAVDWPPVLEVAQANAQAAGAGDRYTTLPGSAFEVDFGTGYDLVLLPNFLHHFDPATCEALLEKIHTALVPGGRVVMLEFIPNPDRVSPPESAGFALVMLATTPSGDAYTFEDYQQMLSHAGFARSAVWPLPPTSQQVVMAYK